MNLEDFFWADFMISLMRKSATFSTLASFCGCLSSYFSPRQPFLDFLNVFLTGLAGRDGRPGPPGLPGFPGKDQ